MKNDLKEIKRLEELLYQVVIPNDNGIGLWPHEIGFEIIALDGKIIVLIGCDAPDALWDTLENLSDDHDLKFGITGDMGYNPSYYTDMKHVIINGGPNEWWVD